jgi:nucleotide-binding universal stress UspA family protein
MAVARRTSGLPLADFCSAEPSKRPSGMDRSPAVREPSRLYDRAINAISAHRRDQRHRQDGRGQDPAQDGRQPEGEVGTVEGLERGRQELMLATDGSPGALFAARWVRRHMRPEAWAVRLVTVVDPVGWTTQGLGMPYAAELPIDESEVARLQHTALEETAAELGDAFVIHEEALEGDPVRVILARVRETHPGLLVVGHRGLRGLPGWVMGSVAKQLVTHASVPILVVPRPNS